MRPFSSMTVIVVAVLTALFMAGVILILRSRATRRGSRLTCPKCGRANPAAAKYCALCGTALGSA